MIIEQNTCAKISGEIISGVISGVIPFKCERPALLPVRANPTDAGLDLRTKELTKLVNLERTLVKTGVRCKIPKGYVGLLVPRSSLSKNSIKMTNSVGIIDSDYRGEIMASLMYDGGNAEISIPALERIVQLVIVPCNLAIAEESLETEEEWNDTERGTGGFGSSGLN